MKQPIKNLFTNINDIKTLLDLSLTLTGIEQKKIIFRSAVVLLIASWEYYIEQLAESSILVLTNRLRDSSTLPEIVKQKVASFSVLEKRNNQHDFSKSVWQFSDKGWKNEYIKYCKYLTSHLNTASSDKVIKLYWNILGIRNITLNWHFLELTPEECSVKLDDLIGLRHDIAHGANSRVDELKEENIRKHTEFVSKIALDTHQSTFDCTAELSQTQALIYPLTWKCFSTIVSFASKKADRTLTIAEIKGLGSSAQGNHNKLRYAPWSLLEFIDVSTRHIPDKLIHFSNNEITLPLEILVFDNNESIAKPGTRVVSFSDLPEPSPA